MNISNHQSYCTPVLAIWLGQAPGALILKLTSGIIGLSNQNMFEWKQSRPRSICNRIVHRGPSEQQPPCFVHCRARGRQERRARVCKIGFKNQFMDYWVLAAALGALEWLGELKFLRRLPESPFLLLLGAV